MESFECGRDFAAWLGLVPKQHSSGGKERLGRVSKAGQSDIRQLLIMGAMSRLYWMGRKSIPDTSWLARMLARKPRMLVAIALANKMAHTMWAMFAKQEDYRARQWQSPPDRKVAQGPNRKEGVRRRRPEWAK